MIKKKGQNKFRKNFRVEFKELKVIKVNQNLSIPIFFSQDIKIFEGKHNINFYWLKRKILRNYFLYFSQNVNVNTFKRKYFTKPDH